jgi:drug/metabolite transporter (DMT)-like permease
MGYLFLLLRRLWRKPVQSMLSWRQLSGRQWFWLVLQGLCGGCLFAFFLLWGMRYTTAAMAGVITSALPAMVIGLSVLFLGEKLHWRTGLCLCLAVAGLLVLNVPQLTDFNQRQLLGDLIVFAALLPEGSYYLLAKKHHLPLPAMTQAFLINVINLLVVALVFVAVLGLPGSLARELANPLIWLVGGSTALFFILWTLGARMVSGTGAGFFTAMMPVSTLLLAAVFLHEAITIWAILGLLLVVASIIWHAWSALRLKRIVAS